MFESLCVVQRSENLHYSLSGLRRDLSMVGAQVLEEIVNFDRYIRDKMRDNLPRTFSILDHIEM